VKEGFGLVLLSIHLSFKGSLSGDFGYLNLVDTVFVFFTFRAAFLVIGVLLYRTPLLAISHFLSWHRTVSEGIKTFMGEYKFTELLETLLIIRISVKY